LLFTENVPLLLYLAFTCLSAIFAVDTIGALFQIFFLAQVFVLYVYLSSTINSRGDILFIMVVLMGTMLIEGGISVAQRFLGLEINVAGIITVNNAGRMAGTLGSPNTAAGYFSLLLAPSISLILAKTERWVKYLAAAASFFGVIGLALTISRGGILAFAISLVILGLMIWVRGRIAPWTAFFVLFIATAILTFGGFTLDQFIGIRENAALARIPLMEIAWRMIVDHPFLGVGANNYVMNIRNYLVPEIGQGFLYVVHNKFLLVWAETGLGGILSFIGFLGLTIWRGWKTWTRDIPVVSYLALGFAAAIAGQMTHMMVEIFDARSEIQALWIAAALLAAMERLSRGDITDAK
jgi:O-antigen ligase